MLWVALAVYAVGVPVTCFFTLRYEVGEVVANEQSAIDWRWVIGPMFLWPVVIGAIGCMAAWDGIKAVARWVTGKTDAWIERKREQHKREREVRWQAGRE